MRLLIRSMALIGALVVGAVVFIFIERLLARSSGEPADLPSGNSRAPNPSSDWHDNPNVVQFNEYAPTGFDFCLAWEAPVAGISFNESAAESFVRGTSQHLELLREPGNRFDKNAIAVLGSWIDSSGEVRHRVMLGHLPREVAAAVAARGPDVKIAAALRIMFEPMDGKGAGLRVNVWGRGEIPARPNRRTRHLR